MAAIGAAACGDGPVRPPPPDAPEQLVVTITEPRIDAAEPGVYLNVNGHVSNASGTPRSGVQVAWEFYDPDACDPECTLITSAVDPVNDTSDGSATTSTRIAFPGLAVRYIVRLRLSDSRFEAHSADSMIVRTVIPATPNR